MADSNTLFPKRDERVPYGGGKPVRSGRENRKRRTKQSEPQRKRTRKGGGKKLNRNLLYLIGIVVVLFIIFLFVRKNGSAVFIAEEQALHLLIYFLRNAEWNLPDI